jgi:hypothetical protein
MHLKRRGNLVSLYRSTWVPKGSAGNTHGFSQQRFVGSLPANSTQLSPELVAKLDDAERAFVDKAVFGPARAAAERLAVEARLRERDPIWRIEQAVSLIEEAAQRSETNKVPLARVTSVMKAASGIQTFESSDAKPAPGPTAQSDPMKDAIAALKLAAEAVRQGRYSTAPAEGMKSTRPYKLWVEIQEALDGAHEGSLMRALQSRGYVKTRSK